MRRFVPRSHVFIRIGNIGGLRLMVILVDLTNRAWAGTDRLATLFAPIEQSDEWGNLKMMHYVTAPHPATLPNDALLRECELTFGRAAGPGGQHRNKVETAVTIRHPSTGIEAHATERRRQYENRVAALRRLRLKLAKEIRTEIDPADYEPTALWESRRQGEQMSINPKHRDYPALLAEAIDVIAAKNFDVGGAAGVLGITMSQLARLVRHDGEAFAAVNRGREERGLPALK